MVKTYRTSVRQNNRSNGGKKLKAFQTEVAQLQSTYDELGKALKANKITEEDVAALGEETLDEVKQNYFYKLRPKQIITDADWWHWIFFCGRGFGKGYAVHSAIVRWANLGMYRRICILGDTKLAVEKNNFRGDSGILALASSFNPAQIRKETVEFANGVIVEQLASKDTDKYRGPSFDVVVMDELSHFANPGEAYRAAAVLARVGGENPARVLITTSPKDIPIVNELLEKGEAEPDQFVIVRGSMYDNTSLDKRYRERITEGMSQFEIEQEIMGEIVSSAATVFPTEIIDKSLITLTPAYIGEHMEWQRIVVGVDPTTTANKSSDEAGIVVAGLGRVKDGDLGIYVLEDLSGVLHYEEWAAVAVDAYYKWGADSIVVESNSLSDITDLVFSTVDANAQITKIHHSTNKLSRARPFRSLLFQNRVRLCVKDDSLLYNQLVDFTGVSKKSAVDDRVDAMLIASADLTKYWSDVDLTMPTTAMMNMISPTNNKGDEGGSMADGLASVLAMRNNDRLPKFDIRGKQW